MGMLRRFHLDQYAHVNPYTLSGGEKRRLTVASALASAPKVLLFDEPTFGQDRRTWMQIVRLIHDLRSDGVSIVVVTHDRELVTALGARVVELVPTRNPQGLGDDVAATIAARLASPQDAVDTTLVPVSQVNERVEEAKPASRSRFLASINPVYRLFGAFLASLPLLASLDWVSASVALGLSSWCSWPSASRRGASCVPPGPSSSVRPARPLPCCCMASPAATPGGNGGG